MRVVFSIDLSSTRVRGDIGEFAILKGLKAKSIVMILFVVAGRVLTRIDMQFNVASTIIASLRVMRGNVWHVDVSSKYLGHLISSNWHQISPVAFLKNL